jgi:predicted DCC family thiol-disulfide oxidoreductase YuxK
MTILYDSQCDFCCWFLDFFEKKKRKSICFLKYDLRTTEARSLLRDVNVKFVNLNTIYLIDDHVLMKSKAVLEILKRTRFPFNAFYFFNILPKKMTDKIYEFVARNRYKIGKLLFHA